MIPSHFSLRFRQIMQARRFGLGTLEFPPFAPSGDAPVPLAMSAPASDTMMVSGGVSELDDISTVAGQRLDEGVSRPDAGAPIHARQDRSIVALDMPLASEYVDARSLRIYCAAPNEGSGIRRRGILKRPRTRGGVGAGDQVKQLYASSSQLQGLGLMVVKQIKGTGLEEEESTWHSTSDDNSPFWLPKVKGRIGGTGNQQGKDWPEEKA